MLLKAHLLNIVLLLFKLAHAVIVLLLFKLAQAPVLLLFNLFYILCFQFSTAKEVS